MDAWSYFFPTPYDISELVASEEDVTAELDTQESESGDLRDRLSELSDSLILLILSFLPMRYVIRTTLLSKRWKDLWTSIPCLDFKGEANDTSRFQNFVNRSLLLWKGTKILKFKIDFYSDMSLSSDLDLWVRVATENEVEELCINLKSTGETGYWAPQRLYSCSSIKKLSLLGCNLEIRGNLHWSQLRSLTIDGVCLSEHVIDQVLSNTPLLEILILRPMESHENLNIESSSLKKLTIQKYLQLGRGGAVDTVLRIWTPNVETLEISGVFYSKCLLMNISSLTDATLGFSGPKYYGNDRFSGYKLHGELLRQIFQGIHHVEKVTLSDWCIKVVSVTEKKDLHPPLSDVKILKLYASRVELGEIMGLFEIFPKLRILVVEHTNYWMYEILDAIRSKSVVVRSDEENYLKPQMDFAKSFLLHLRRVEIAWFLNDASIFPFVEFLLKHGGELEKMVIKFGRITSVAPESLFSLAQKLLRMPRSSPTAEVILCK